MQVHAADLGGGAEQMAYMLHHEFLSLGYNAYLVVGRALRAKEERVIEIPQTQRWRGECRLKRFLERQLGLQYFYSPGTSRLPTILPSSPDVLLIHSMHGANGYFNIADLPKLSRRWPTFLYLQDQWSMTGHCSYSLGCSKWKTGCGKCPDLSISPAIPKDGTRWNWRRKYHAYSRSRLVVGSAAQWILDLAAESPLLSRFPQYLVPNGADLSVFSPGSRRDARARLGLPLEGQMILFLAQKGAKSGFKDFETLASAFRMLRQTGNTCKLVTVGGEPSEETRQALPPDVIFHPFTSNRRETADYYRAANLFCHITKADVCPLTIIESQACGTPVVATAVGGVPEIVREQETGWLVPLGEPECLADRIEDALNDSARLETMGLHAAQHAAQHFDIAKLAERFLDVFARHQPARPAN